MTNATEAMADGGEAGAAAGLSSGPAERALHAAARGLAFAGGALFLGLVALSLVSIVGRKLFAAPVHGDIELMQMGAAVATAAFLPYCTVKREHLKVDFLTEAMRDNAKRRMDGMADLLLAAVFALLTWRTAFQAVDLRDVGEVTPLLSIPMWLPVLCIVPSLALTTLCALYRGLRDLAGGFIGRAQL